jgi:hypothetical protein
MANQFSSIKTNQASEKFYLIRMTPRRYINNAMTSIGGGLYTAPSSGFIIAGIKENGTPLTPVTGTPLAGQYNFDEENALLTIYPNSAPSSTNIIIVEHYLFYTQDRHRVVYEDPESNTTPLRDWVPRIRNNPVISSSVENIVFANLSINISSLTLINNNKEFNQYIGDDDSFHKAEIKIWLCLDEIENIQKIYDGKITRINLTETNVNFNFDDPLSGLVSPALMGDDSDAYFNLNDIPNLFPNDNGRPIPYIFGSVSRYVTVADNTIAGLPTAQKVEQSSLYNAACINYTNAVSSTTNREWGLCRVDATGFLDFSFTPTNIDNSAPGYTRLDGTANEINKFKVGDTFRAEYLTVSYYLRVVYVDRANNYLYTTKEAALMSGAIVYANDCPTIVVTDEQANTHLCLAERDYTTSVTTTSGGNKYLKITFTDNFEANHAGLTALDPGAYKVKYRVRPDTTNHKHGSVVKSILENAGLSVDIASVTAANAALDVNCNFSIPTFDQVDYGTYVSYLERVLASAFAYIGLNNDFQIEYHLFQAPNSTNEVTDIDILKDSVTIEVNYQDIINQIVAYNPHYSASEAVENTSDSPSATETYTKSKYLHDIKKTTRFVHFLESINARLAEIIKVRGERYALYNLDTKLINIDNIIGDDILLKTDTLLGGSTSKQLKIVRISKQPSKTNIIASDLLNL